MGKNDLLAISAQVDSSITQAHLTSVFVTTKITNESSDTIRYLSMSCSWQDPYTIDGKELVVQRAECDKNVPQLVEVPPLGVIQVVLHLCSSKTIDELKQAPFRIGFNCVTARDSDEMFLNLSQLRDMKNVVWSDTMRVQ
jgi:hypothetical protein